MRLRPEQAKTAAQGLLDRHNISGVTVEQLAGVLNETSLQKLRPGDALCVEGDLPDALFFILEGRIVVQRRDPTGKMRELAVIKGPAMVGHMALIDNHVRSASCLAKSFSSVARMDRSNYEKLVDSATEPGRSLRRLLLVSLTEQLSKGNARIRELIHIPDSTVTTSSRLNPNEERVEKPTRKSRLEIRMNQAAAKPKATSKPAPSAKSIPSYRDEITEDDLQKVTNLLEGWDQDLLNQLDEVKVVRDDEQVRRQSTKKKLS